MRHNPRVVEAFWQAHGVPLPIPEYKFDPDRKWRFDYAWLENHGNASFDLPDIMTPFIALEVEGGIWTGGRHNSGAGFIRDMEKYNEASALGWRIIRCPPEALLTTATANLVKRCLGIL
jgi:hypothetical protein